MSQRFNSDLAMVRFNSTQLALAAITSIQPYVQPIEGTVFCIQSAYF